MIIHYIKEFEIDAYVNKTQINIIERDKIVNHYINPLMTTPRAKTVGGPVFIGSKYGNGLPPHTPSPGIEKSAVLCARIIAEEIL